MSRPEFQAPPELFYNETESKKYAQNSRMLEIQTTMSERALELLALPEGIPMLLLDIGCGSGISGEVLSENGHTWVGLDISPHMLDMAVQRETDGDLFLQDMGAGMSFRIGVFDGAISISALQWLCNADSKSHVPQKRLSRFFTTLYRCLRKGARAVFQFYPQNPMQMDMITTSAMRAGFGGGIVVDYPHSTKAKKYFLVLMAGVDHDKLGAGFTLPKAKGVGDDEDLDDVVSVATAHTSATAATSATATSAKVFTVGAHRRKNHEKKRYVKGHERAPIKSKQWILEKKASDRMKGKKVRPDSKYTGRKRSKVRL